MPAFLVLVYTIIGLALSIPYVILSGGDFADLFPTGIIAPIAALVLIFFFAGRRTIGRLPFGAAATYFCLLILFFWGSRAADWLEYPDLRDLLLEYRYSCLLYILMVALLAAVIISLITAGVAELKRRFA